MVKNLPAMQEAQIQSLLLQKSPGEGNGYVPWYSCLEDPMDRGAWQATDHGVTRSQTRLSNWTTKLFIYMNLYVHFFLGTMILRFQEILKGAIYPEKFKDHQRKVFRSVINAKK